MKKNILNLISCILLICFSLNKLAAQNINNPQQKSNSTILQNFNIFSDVSEKNLKTNKTNFFLVSEFAINPQLIIDKIFKDDLLTIPELALILMNFQNNEDSIDSGYFGIDFSKSIKFDIFFNKINNNYIPQAILQFELLDFEKLISTLSYFSSGKIKISSLADKNFFNKSFLLQNQQELFELEILIKPNDLLKFPVFKKENQLFIVIDNITQLLLKKNDKLDFLNKIIELSDAADTNRYLIAAQAIDTFLVIKKNLSFLNNYFSLENKDDLFYIYSISIIDYLKKIYSEFIDKSNSNNSLDLKNITDNLSAELLTLSITDNEFRFQKYNVLKEKKNLINIDLINFSAANIFFENQNDTINLVYINSIEKQELLKIVNNLQISISGAQYYLTELISSFLGIFNVISIDRKNNDNNNIYFFNNNILMLFLPLNNNINLEKTLDNLTALLEILADANICSVNFNNNIFEIKLKTEYLNNLKIFIKVYSNKYWQKEIIISTSKDIFNFIDQKQQYTSALYFPKNYLKNWIYNKSNSSDSSIWNYQFFFTEIKPIAEYLLKYETTNDFQKVIINYLKDRLGSFKCYYDYFSEYSLLRSNNIITKKENIFVVDLLKTIFKKK